MFMSSFAGTSQDQGNDSCFCWLLDCEKPGEVIARDGLIVFGVVEDEDDAEHVDEMLS
jgi:hypothetical protein